MQAFGTGGFFVIAIIVFIYAIFNYGWTALLAMVLFIYGYIHLLGMAGRTFNRDGSFKRKERRRR